jgi:hypothetical protein
MGRPTVTVNCTADRYANHDNERIIEFFDKDCQKGGLIGIYRADDGNLIVAPYCLDDGVVVMPPRKTGNTPRDTQPAETPAARENALRAACQEALDLLRSMSMEDHQTALNLEAALQPEQTATCSICQRTVPVSQISTIENKGETDEDGNGETFNVCDRCNTHPSKR